LPSSAWIDGGTCRRGDPLERVDVERGRLVEGAGAGTAEVVVARLEWWWRTRS
jgi:hypothetical protein